MPPTFPPRPSFRRLTWLALPALALAGCGIADYEKKMQEAEVRMDRFDAENKLLGDPLTLPPHKDNEGPPFDVFLRPPKGVAAKDTTQPGESMYHYPATGGYCTDLYLGFGNVGDERDKLERQVEAIFGAPPQTWQSVPSSRPFGGAALTFDRVEFVDPRAPANAPANCVVYVHQEPGQPAAAVVFRFLQANRAFVDEAVKMSMQTYAERGDAPKARTVSGKPLEW